MNKIIKRTVFLIFAALIAVVLFKDTEVQGNVKIYSGGKNIHRGDRRKRIQDLKEIRLKEVQASLKDKKNQRDLTVIVEGNKVKLSSPIVFSYNRYYFSIDELLSLYGYKVKKAENMVYINSNDNKITINLKERLININGKVEPLRGEVEMVEGKVYASLFDICRIGNLVTRWNTAENKIAIYSRRGNKINSAKDKRDKSFKKAALVRFEDLAPMDTYLGDDSLEKLRALGDRMEDNNSPFHIAWIPRYVNPPEGIDNSLLDNRNMKNAHFLFTLDYLISKGGNIGLHGYTHQYEEEESIVGSEFWEKYNLSRREQRERVEKAIESAQYLNLPYKFFETPHYRANVRFQQLLEQYFDFVYEPSIALLNNKPAFSPFEGKTMFVPAPLGYVKDDNVGEMIGEIEKLKGEDFFSFYYHPGKEFKYITLESEKDGYPYYRYEEGKGVIAVINKLKSIGAEVVSLDSIKAKALEKEK